MKRYQTPERRGWTLTILELDMEKVVGAMIKGMEKERHEVVSGRTGCVLFPSNRFPYGSSRWIKDVQKNRYGSAS